MAHYLIGIDEAGYGPSLGPLVVTAIVFKVPSIRTNLWLRLAKVITKRPRTSSLIPVCDSKLLYQSARGIKPLETSVLTFASLLTTDSVTIKRFMEKIDHNKGQVSSLPWYGKYKEMSIPLEAEKEKISELSRLLKSECLKKSIRLEKVCSRIISADNFNSKVGQIGNKAELLFEITAELLTDVCKSYLKPADSLRSLQANKLAIFIDKQGGRTYYKEHLKKVFPSHLIQCLKQKANCSKYAISRVPHGIRLLPYQENKCTVEFTKDGDSKHFTIALASMFCKYTRELCMKMFNTFWQEHLPTLKPTAGYYQDSQRFIGEIMPLTKKLGLPPEDFVRMRS